MRNRNRRKNKSSLPYLERSTISSSFTFLSFCVGLAGLRLLSPVSAASPVVPNPKIFQQAQWSLIHPLCPAVRTFSSVFSSFKPTCTVGATRLLEPDPSSDPPVTAVRGLNPNPNRPFGERIVRRRKMKVRCLKTRAIHCCF